MAKFIPAEISGILLNNIPITDRLHLNDPNITCPFDKEQCTKPDHVCTIRQHQIDLGELFEEEKPPIVAVCPRRFHQTDKVHAHIRNIIFGNRESIRQPEFRLPFKRRNNGKEEHTKLDFLYIGDDILCGVEYQAVYFSGDAMTPEITAIMASKDRIVTPVGDRHPDYKSSSFKRLWPQITLDWDLLQQVSQVSGKTTKLVIVVDRSFMNSLPLSHEGDLRAFDAEIFWIVVDFKDQDQGAAEMHIETIYSTFDVVRALFTDVELDQRAFNAGLNRICPISSDSMLLL
jgi:hypothetical protein